MDEQRFDHLSRRFATFRTRRQALKAVAGAVVASVAGVRTTDAQQCAAHDSPCTGDDQCCSGAVCEFGLCMPGCRIDGSFVTAWMSPPDTICGQCRPELSTIAWSPANEGMSCWSGDPNAGATFCQNGACAPSAASCPPPTPCHLEGEIDPATGMCVNPPAPAGAPCGGQAMCHGNFHQPADMCDGNGACIGGGSQTVNCAPYRCGDGACETTCSGDGACLDGTVCCDGSCVHLNTIDHCSGCGDACTPVDPCTPVECLDDGSCNEVSTCTGLDTCGGGGIAGQCGCTPSNPVCQQTCHEPDGCGFICFGKSGTNPVISITFAPTSDPDLCVPTVHISGDAGCSLTSVGYWSSETSDGSRGVEFIGYVASLSDAFGSSHTDVAPISNQGRWIAFGFSFYSSGWQHVTC